MASHHKIIGNEAWDHSAHRFSPAHGSIRMFNGHQFRWKGAFAWVRWWHFAGLITAGLLMIDRLV